MVRMTRTMLRALAVLRAPLEPWRGATRSRSRSHLIVLMLLVLAPPAMAATFTVETVVDEDDAVNDGSCASQPSGRCTLRAALRTAQALSGPDVVVLPTGLYSLTLIPFSEGDWRGGSLDVADDVVIEGAGASSTIIDAGRIDRAFLISGCSVAMSDLTIRRGRTAGAGAGISMRNGNLELSRVILTENEASRGGAALDAADGSVVATLRDCEITWNEGLFSSGGIVVAPGATYDHCLVHHNNLGPLSFPNGLVGPSIVRSCSITDNGASVMDGAGGGLQLLAPAGEDVLVEDTLIARNTARLGAGIWCTGDMTGRIVIRRCAIIDNVGNLGGGVKVWVPTFMENCTVSGNAGGGIERESGTLTLAHCTITDNTLRGGIDSAGTGVTMTATILAGNSNPSGLSDCQFASLTIASGGHNVIQVANCAITGGAGTDLVGIDPVLLPLADNGGAGPSRLPGLGSPLVDAVPAAACLDLASVSLTTDQRLILRPQDGESNGIADCDIGAVEVPSGCAIDSDGDEVGDGCDCAPSDPGAFGTPAEVLILAERLASRDDVRLLWTDLAPATGPGITYDVACERLSVLHAVRVASGPCVIRGIGSPTWDDSRPIQGDGHYYLVRGVNACTTGSGTWGTNSLGIPRPACP